MKKLNYLGFSLVVLVLLTGCGGSSTSTSTSETGTGYYVDSAVKGVNYVCGEEIGTTDSEGKFIFEVGKDCSFSLAGIPLRTTVASDLVDGKKVLENDPKVARFLQSIDIDGNVSNGIQIEDSVITALTAALVTNDSAAKVPEDTILEGVVNSLNQSVPAFEGRLRTPAEVTAHLAETQTEITKALLAGKTFYAYFIDNDNNGKPTVAKVIFNKDVTEFIDEENNVINVSINGSVVTFTYPDDGTDVMSISTENDKYVLFKEDEDDEFKFFYNQADAEALLSTTSINGSDTLSELIVGKTLYLKCTNNTMEMGVFQTNGKLVWTENGETDTLPYRIDGDTLYITEDDGEEDVHPLLSSSTESITFQDYDDKGQSDGTSTFYFTKALAEANPKNDCGSEDSYETENNTGKLSIFGTNTYFSGSFSNMKDYTFLSYDNGLSENITGSYKYYIIANENSKVDLLVDAVKGSNSNYYGTSTTSNTGDTWMNLEGAPDKKKVNIGSYGYILIDASNDNINSITIY